MPFYEYKCEACGHHLEALQKISDEPLVDCPACAGQALRRLISAPAFRLKGGGWYETDFKAGDRKRNLADGSDAASAASPSSKPEAAKPEPAPAAAAGPAAAAKSGTGE